jgi:hypothetical protein
VEALLLLLKGLQQLECGQQVHPMLTACGLLAAAAAAAAMLEGYYHQQYVVTPAALAAAAAGRPCYQLRDRYQQHQLQQQTRLLLEMQPRTVKRGVRVRLYPPLLRFLPLGYLLSLQLVASRLLLLLLLQQQQFVLHFRSVTRAARRVLVYPGQLLLRVWPPAAVAAVQSCAPLQRTAQATTARVPTPAAGCCAVCIAQS